MVNDEQRLFQALLRNNLEGFIAKSLLEITGKSYLESWHIKVMAAYLQDLYIGRYNRLMINLPPRHLKSLCVSVIFPAWILGHQPKAKLIGLSYSNRLSKELQRQCRELMMLPFYRNLFPSTLLAGRHGLSTTQGGGYLASSVKASLTGMGADYLIIDDPLKAIHAENRDYIKEVNDWFLNTCISRLNDQAKGKVIIVMQRLAYNDLCGHLHQTQAGIWQHLRLPALADKHEEWSIQNRNYQRDFDEPLDYSIFSKDQFVKLRQQVGEAIFMAQYQQAPLPFSGNLIKRDSLHLADRKEWPNFMVYVYSCDVKPCGANRYSVLMTLWGSPQVNHQGTYYFIEAQTYQCSSLAQAAEQIATVYQEKLANGGLSVALIAEEEGNKMLDPLLQKYGLHSYFLKTPPEEPKDDEYFKGQQPFEDIKDESCPANSYQLIADKTGKVYCKKQGYYEPASPDACICSVMSQNAKQKPLALLKAGIEEGRIVLSPDGTSDPMLAALLEYPRNEEPAYIDCVVRLLRVGLLILSVRIYTPEDIEEIKKGNPSQHD